MLSINSLITKLTRSRLPILLTTIYLSACSTQVITGTPHQGEAPAILITQTATPDPTQPPTPEPPSPTPADATTPLPPDPFAGLRIDDLASRAYGGSGIKLGDEVLPEEGFTNFRRWEMSYDSDGLRITGLVNYPLGVGPFPVIIVNHGYVRPDRYESGMDTWRIANWFAQHGYIALMPDYRNHAGSDVGSNPFHIGYAIDVMNLVAQAHTLPQSIPGQIGMIGHSMGGEIAMWPMVLSQDLDAVVLYGSMSGDIAVNWEFAVEQWPVQRDAMHALALVYGTPTQQPEGYAAISPATYLDRVRMPVIIHHGMMDDVVPIAWSETLFNDLEALGADVAFFPYGGGHHTLTGENFALMMSRTHTLFERTVLEDINHPPQSE